MSKIIKISDDDYAALLDVAEDRHDWMKHVVSAAIVGAIRERRDQPGWMTVAVSFAVAGGDPEDDKGVLLHGLSTGAFKDARARFKEAKAAMKSSMKAETETPAKA